MYVPSKRKIFIEGAHKCSTNSQDIICVDVNGVGSQLLEL